MRATRRNTGVECFFYGTEIKYLHQYLTGEASVDGDLLKSWIASLEKAINER